MLPKANVQNLPAQGGRSIVVRRQQSLFIFACLFAKINKLCLGIAKMVLKKPTCVSHCNDFVCFGVAPTCGANKLIAINGQTAPLSRRKKCVGKKKQKIFLGVVCESARSRDVKLYVSFSFVKTLCYLSTDVDGRITYNVVQAGVSFLLVQVMHLSVNTQKITLAWCYSVVGAHTE